MRWLPLVLLTMASVGCSSGPAPVAYENRTFYEYGLGPGIDPGAFEKHYPPLDLAAKEQTPEYMGVSILGGQVRISRPKNWIIRTAGNQPNQHYIQYVSRNQYLVAIWERPDFSSDLWRDVLTRYQQSIKDAGGEVIGGPIPIATGNAQGRAYVIKKIIPAAKGPLSNGIREYVIRGSNKIILMQIVHPDGELPDLSTELLRVLTTLEVN
jgi:hypothetical protein